ncbi:unnamed protein product [Psylliodes chrysocephalus]|uniref:Uncharacterized protein n=1 Tax=Psylliodes chrysocephalus TaxID=3402493 RepID=A0A9P0GGK2_9CUCU|nr:unnamed protein product [Psylliodes chrysocephala]
MIPNAENTASTKADEETAHKNGFKKGIFATSGIFCCKTYHSVQEFEDIKHLTDSSFSLFLRLVIVREALEKILSINADVAEKVQKRSQVSEIWPYNPFISSQDDFLPSAIPSTNLVTGDIEEVSIQDLNVYTSDNVGQLQNVRESDVINLGASSSKASTDVGQSYFCKSDANNFVASSSKAPGQKPKRYVQFKELSPIVNIKKQYTGFAS